MKRHFTYAAAVLLLADVLVLGAAWKAAPALALAAALAEPKLESLFAPLYDEAVREDVLLDVTGASLRGDFYRPARPRSALVLVDDVISKGSDTEAIRLARALARRDIAVLVPQSSSTRVPLHDEHDRVVDAALDYARGLGLPVDVVTITTLRLADEPTSVAVRAAYVSRLVRFTSTLLTAR